MSRLRNNLPLVALLTPALLMVGLLFIYPLMFSLAYAFRNEDTGGWFLGNFTKAFALYGGDIWLTVGVTLLSTALVGVLSIAIAGYLTRGKTRGRWPCCAGSIAGRCSSRSSSPRS